MRRTLLSLLVVASAFLAGCDRTDRSFGQDGVSRIGFEPTDAVARAGTSGFVATGQLRDSDQTTVAAIGADGKVRWQVAIPTRFHAVSPVATFAGDAVNVVGTTAGRIDVAQVRNGAIDPTYGTNGIASTNVRIDQGSRPAALTDSQGRTVVVGQRGLGLIYARVDGDGDLDREIALSLERSTAVFADAVMTAGDKVLVAYARVGAGPNGETSDLVVARLLPTGAIDPTFGGNGIVTIAGDLDIAPSSLVVRPDGRIVVAGSTVKEDGTPQLLLAGLTAAGEPDPAFGVYGLSIVDDRTSGDPVLTLGGPGLVLSATAPGGDVVTWGFSAAGVPDDAWGDKGRQVNDLGGAVDVADAVQRGDRTLVLTSTVDAPGGALLALT